MADKPPTAAMPPAREPFPGSRTPGWNDPPTLAPLTAVPGAPGRPRINLNKRVAYPLNPLQGSSVTSAPTSKPTAVVLPNQTSTGGLPPPPPMAVNAPTATMQPVAVVHPMPHSNNQQESIELPPEAFSLSFRCLRDSVPLVQESINVRREEIERRLGIIEQLWQSDNLSAAVKQKIYNLSLAVQRSAHNEAMEIYTSLVANHASECTSWAVTLRHIVLTISSTQTPPANTNESAVFTTAATTGGSGESSLMAPSGGGGNTTNLVSTTILPTMSVTAMPRSATNSSELGGNDATAAAAAIVPISRVQHI